MIGPSLGCRHVTLEVIECGLGAVVYFGIIHVVGLKDMPHV